MKKLMTISIALLLAYLPAACSSSDNAPATMAAVTPAATPLAAATSTSPPPATPTTAATRTPSPPDTPTVEPSGEPAPSSTPVTELTGEPASSALEFPYGNADVAGEEQAPGRYQTPGWFSFPFTFETAQVFRGIGEQFTQGELFGLAQGGPVLPPRQLLFWTVLPDISTEAAISELRATPQLEFSPTQTVTVAGMSGAQLDATTQKYASMPVLGKFVGLDKVWSINSPQAHLRFILLTVAGRTLLVYIEAPSDEFQDFMREVDQVLGTMKFRQS
jgi:hypothetical protein